MGKPFRAPPRTLSYVNNFIDPPGRAAAKGDAVPEKAYAGGSIATPENSFPSHPNV